MNQRCRRLLQIALPLIALCLCAFPSKATTVVMLSDNELISNSRFIITGSVRSVISDWDDAHTAIWTYVEVRTDRFLKGSLSERTLVLKQLGGTAGSSGMRVHGQPQFSRGQQVLLYLNTGPDGTLHVAHAFMGMFSVVEESVTGRKIVTREVDANEVEILSRPDSETITNRAPFDSYVQNIETKLNRTSIQTAEANPEQADQPVVAAPPEYARKKRAAKGFSPEFTFIGGGVRWVEPDSGQAVTFLVNPANSPTVGGATAELSRAMSAWATQSGSRINLQIAGQTSSCGMITDHINTISFGDCLGQLDTPFGCAGVVATTSAQYVNQMSQIGGRTFFRLIESDVVFNKGMNCFLSTSANLAEVACHELGHSIGLAHSGDVSAIMWAVAHGGGRDAVLGDDDKSGVLTIYPASPGGGGGGGGGGGTTPVAITSISLGSGTVGKNYRQSLTAIGGTPPYRWTLLGGGMPPGLNFSSVGVIEGTPTKAGSYFMNVQVVDSTGSPSRVDSKPVSIDILSANNTAPSVPVITKVKVKKKKFFVYGTNFNQNSLIVLNGIVFVPKTFEQNGALGELFYKGKRDIGPTGTNQLIVINSDSRSAIFIF